MSNSTIKSPKHSQPQSPPDQKPIELIKILKSCTEQAIFLFKICELTPKIPNHPRNVLEYGNNLLNMLKNVVDFLGKSYVQVQVHERLKQELEKVLGELESSRGQNRSLRCENGVLEERLAETEAKLLKIQAERAKQKKCTIDFQQKLNQIKKDSQQGIKKLIQLSREAPSQQFQRKHSLPNISRPTNSNPNPNTYANKEKLGLLFLMNTPLHKPPRKKNNIARHIDKNLEYR